MRGELTDAQDPFLGPAPITAVPGKSFVVTNVVITVTATGSVILSLGTSPQINLGNFPVGLYAIGFPAGVVISDKGVGPSTIGTATAATMFGGYTTST